MNRMNKMASGPMIVAAAIAASASMVPAAPIYWGAAGTTNSWGVTANWYLDAAETSVSSALPTINDDVIFNTTPDAALGGSISVGLDIAAKSLTFNTSAATTLSQSGNRVLTLGTGGITVNSGAGNATLGISTNTLLVQLAGDQTWTNNSTSTLNVRSFRVSNTASGPVALTLNAANTGGISFNLSAGDSPDATKPLSVVVDSTGSGTVTMVGSAYTGGTTVKRGVLTTNGTLGSGDISLGEVAGTGDARLNATGGVANNIIVQTGTGSRAITGTGSGNFQGNIALNRDVALGSVSGAGQSITYSGDISGNGGITVGRVATGTASPTVTLSGNSTFTGKTTVESAILVVSSLNSVVGGSASSNLGAPTTIANGTISFSTVASSTLRYIGEGETTDRVIDMAGTTLGVTLEQAGTGHLKFTSDLSTSGNGNKTLALRGATEGTAEFAGTIANSTGTTIISKQDSGTWRLSGLNTYTGSTTIAGGVLEVTKLANANVASSIGAPTSTVGSTVLNGTGTLRYIGTGDSTNRVFTIGGGGGGSLDASGTGAIVFANSSNSAFGSGNVAYVLNLIGVNTDNNTYAANQGNNGTGAFSITKSGTGTWVLSGNSTYTGPTTVSGGLLKITGSLGNTAVSVEDTATLSGSGSIGGAVTVNAGGTLSPGNSPGIQNVGGLVLNDGGHYNWQMLDAAGIAGTGYDSYNLTGSLDLAGLTGTTPFNINLWSLASTGPDVNGNAANFDNSAEQSWTLIATPNAITGFSAADFAVNVAAFNGTGGFSNALAGGTFTVGLSGDGTDLVLNYTPVPEPSAIALIAIGFVGLARRRRDA